MKYLLGLYVVLLFLIVFLANAGLLETFGGIPGFDKAGHFFLMGLLSFMANMLTSGRRVRVFCLNVLVASVVVAAFVTLEEASQAFLAYRSFSLGDLFFDYAGIWSFGRLAAMLARHSQDGQEVGRAALPRGLGVAPPGGRRYGGRMDSSV